MNAEQNHNEAYEAPSVAVYGTLAELTAAAQCPGTYDNVYETGEQVEVPLDQVCMS